MPNAPHYGDFMDYKSWDNDQWRVRVKESGELEHERKDGGEISRSDCINYISWDNKRWTAWIQDDEFRHRGPSGAEHCSVHITYLSSGGDDRWNAIWIKEKRKFFHF